METIRLEDQKEFVPFAGYHGRLVHSESMTVAHWDIKGGHEIPEHSHPHEQIINMMEGEFELRINGSPRRLVAGDVVVVPGDVPHSGVSITDCKIIDVWNPVREDYRATSGT